MPDWDRLTERTLAELDAVPQTYRPTNFWGPGVEKLLAEMRQHGLERFKSWPSASVWFYPLYGDGWSEARLGTVFEKIGETHPKARRGFFDGALNGGMEARRDIDVAAAFWDQQRWPFDVTGFGESQLGTPWQRYSVQPGSQERFGRAYANYLLCLAALSRHVDAPPRSFLEIGGGYGALGEIVMQRDPQARYVDLDIPPLLTVASYYLSTLFGDEAVQTYDVDAPADEPIDVPRSGVLPNYAVERLTGPFEVFVNTFSFQEMEPDVVDHYVGQVCDKGIRYAVSLNSRDGKPRAAEAGRWGALDPVRSADIADMFARRGLERVGCYDTPLVRSAGQVNVFARRGD